MTKNKKEIQSGRTMFAEGIVAEFWIPKKPSGKAFIIVDGCPSVPSKHLLGEFLARKGYWVFHPRYRGSWESKGEFLKYSPEEDVRIVALSLNLGFKNIYDDVTYLLDIKEINVIGASFGGASAILASRYPEINKVFAFAPVTDWAYSGKYGKGESFNDFKRQLSEGFGDAYRFPDKNLKKLLTGKFFNPTAHMKEFDGGKIFLAHAKDDTVISYQQTISFAKLLGIKPLILAKGGHLFSRLTTTPEVWKKVSMFLRG